MKRLLIEDPPATQTPLQRAVERAGLQVMSCGDGLEVPAHARAAGPHTQAIIPTTRGNTGDRIVGLNTSADDLSKPFGLDRLETRVRALVHRSAGHAHKHLPTGTQAAAGCGMHIEKDSGPDSYAHQPLALTPHETVLLRVLLGQPGHPLAREQLFKPVFPDPANPTFPPEDSPALAWPGHTLHEQRRQHNKSPPRQMALGGTLL